MGQVWAERPHRWTAEDGRRGGRDTERASGLERGDHDGESGRPRGPARQGDLRVSRVPLPSPWRRGHTLLRRGHPSLLPETTRKSHCMPGRSPGLGAHGDCWLRQGRSVASQPLGLGGERNKITHVHAYAHGDAHAQTAHAHARRGIQPAGRPAPLPTISCSGPAPLTPSFSPDNSFPTPHAPTSASTLPASPPTEQAGDLSDMTRPRACLLKTPDGAPNPQRKTLA